MAGVKPQSARDLVRRLGLVSIGRDQDTGAKFYDRRQAEAALAARPGQGNRGDLGRRKRPFTAAELRQVGTWEEQAKRALNWAGRIGEGRAADALRVAAE